MKNKVVIYHKGCNDGFGAAWAAWKKLGDKAEYLGEEHNSPIPNGLEGKEVYIVDFSYPMAETKKILKMAKSLAIIDHHISAKEVIHSVPSHVFDNDHSGAVLAWTYFHPDKPVPKLLKHIEDVDLWKFNLKNTREIIAALDLYRFDFKEWTKFGRDLEKASTLKKHIEAGKTIKKYEERIIEKAVYRSNVVKFEGHETIAVNSSVLTSEIGNTLVNIMPPIAIIFSQIHGKKIVSLRSNGKVDVSKLASKYGGGGHRASAGFSLKLDEDYPWKILKEGKFEIWNTKK